MTTPPRGSFWRVLVGCQSELTPLGVAMRGVPAWLLGVLGSWLAAWIVLTGLTAPLDEPFGSFDGYLESALLEGPRFAMIPACIAAVAWIVPPGMCLLLRRIKRRGASRSAHAPLRTWLLSPWLLVAPAMLWFPFRVATAWEGEVIDPAALGPGWTVTVPMKIAGSAWWALAFVIALCMSAVLGTIESRRLAGGLGECDRCGYDRSGLPPGARCPECGAECTDVPDQSLAERTPRSVRRTARSIGGMLVILWRTRDLAARVPTWFAIALGSVMFGAAITTMWMTFRAPWPDKMDYVRYLRIAFRPGWSQGLHCCFGAALVFCIAAFVARRRGFVLGQMVEVRAWMLSSIPLFLPLTAWAVLNVLAYPSRRWIDPVDPFPDWLWYKAVDALRSPLALLPVLLTLFTTWLWSSVAARPELDSASRVTPPSAPRAPR